jgi:putative Holliday junction resolvase
VDVTINQLKSSLKTGERLLGIDMGSKTIGLALSDITLTIATPLETIRRTKFKIDVERMRDIVNEHGIKGFVLGLPLNMDGTEGSRCQSTRAFAENLVEKIDLPLAFWDERLSTAAVTRTLIEADVTRKGRKQVVDKMAAAFILQGALDVY